MHKLARSAASALFRSTLGCSCLKTALQDVTKWTCERSSGLSPASLAKAVVSTTEAVAECCNLDGSNQGRPHAQQLLAAAKWAC